MRARMFVFAMMMAMLVVVGSVSSKSYDVKSSDQSPILIGISAAKTGPIGPYDLQQGQLFQMVIDQVNKAGGVRGRKIAVRWLDSKSDKATAAANTKLLLSQGAVAIVGTGDFDYGSPAVLTAAANKTAGVFFCASAWKSADPRVVTPYGGTFCWGSDTEGAAMAEWMRAEHPEWGRVYIEKDTSLEYSIDTADYFEARFRQLGGKICGEDAFVGSSTLDLSSNVTRLRGAVDGCDAIYDGSWNPYGAQLIRAVRDAGIKLPIVSNAATQGSTVKEVAGNVSDFYTVAFACVPGICRGKTSPIVRRLNAQFKARYGQSLGSPYPLLGGYELPRALVKAIGKAGPNDKTKIARALFNQTVDFLGNPMRLAPKCHRPSRAVYSIQKWTNGVNREVGTWRVRLVPNLGNGNSCAGRQ